MSQKTTTGSADDATLAAAVHDAAKALNSAMATARRHGLRSLVTLDHGANSERSVSIEVERFKS